MASAKRGGLGIGLLVAIAAGALSFGLEAAGEQARPANRSCGGGEAERAATREMRPIPKAGPLAQPKLLGQVGLPTELTRRAIPSDNSQMPEKIALGQKLFFRRPPVGRVDCACSTCQDPSRAFTDGRPTSSGINRRAVERNAPAILNALYIDMTISTSTFIRQQRPR
jgi:Di-haem cytochrome c peroxidase